jgi:hypothetical protein
MAIAKINLLIESGSKFEKKYLWQDENKAPIDNSLYEARMQIRSNLESSGVELELTTANGGLTLGGVNGEIDLYIGATDTEALTITTGVYDLELYNPLDADEVVRLIQGYVNIIRDVTR